MAKKSMVDLNKDEKAQLAALSQETGVGLNALA